MKLSIVSDNTTVFLSKAILVYQEASRHMSYLGSTAFASIHEVSDTGTKAKPNVQIMPGTPISQEDLLKLMGSLADKYVSQAEILPASVLSFSPSHLVWWMPAGTRTVFFNNRELGKKSAVVPHPPLLFMVVQGQWSVFALNANVRPTAETVLFHAPYFNVFDTGSICAGSAVIPKQLSTTSIPIWEAAFFDSEFTHVNGHTKKIAHPDGEYAFWKAMLDGQYKEFPLDLLVDFGMTLGGAIQNLGRVRGGY